MAESTVGSTGRIFISYRRDETAYPAGWLFDRLAQHFGPAQIFKDVDSIELGDDFVQVISRAVGSCDVLLALIGDRWLTITDDRGRRRLDDPDDFVRLEIGAALERNVRIIPILVDGANMPRADELPAGLVGLERRQALELSPSRFEYDTNRLLKVLDMTLAEVRSVRDDAAVISTAAARRAVQDNSEADVPLAGTASDLLAEEDADVTQPAAHHSHESAPSKASASDERGPRKNGSDLGRSRTLRRLVMIGVALAAVLAVYFIIQFVLDELTVRGNNGAQPSGSNEFRRRHRGGSSFVTTALATAAL
jgi:TIR domain